MRFFASRTATAPRTSDRRTRQPMCQECFGAITHTPDCYWAVPVKTVNEVNPILDSFRNLDGSAGWWADDIRAYLDCTEFTGTDAILDILDAVNNASGPVDQLTVNSSPSGRQVQWLEHAYRVFVRVQAMKRAVAA